MQKITIFGPITDEMATALRSQLDTLNRAEPLLVEINSAYSTRWWTRFQADGGQCSSVMADTVPR